MFNNKDEKYFYLVFYNNGEVEIEKFSDKTDLEIYAKIKYEEIRNSLLGDYRMWVFEGIKWNLKRDPLRFEKIEVNDGIEKRDQIIIERIKKDDETNDEEESLSHKTLDDGKLIKFSIDEILKELNKSKE
ncbi:MAG: hypothetical protein QXP60_02580 [Nitrososphaerota archaeon]